MTIKKKPKGASMTTTKCITCGSPYRKEKAEFIGRVKTFTYPTCDCHEKETKKKAAKVEGIKLKNKIKAIKDCGIGKRFKDKTFANFDHSQNYKGYRACLDYARYFPTMLKEGMGLLLYGAVGTGKTHLTGAIVDYIARYHKRQLIMLDIIFSSSVNILSEIRLGYRSQQAEQICESYERATLLIIDDLGTEKVTDWVHELFYRIIDYRYSNLKPTIITTNFQMSEIAERLGDRFVSRIRAMCKGVKFEGNDWRLK